MSANKFKDVIRFERRSGATNDPDYGTLLEEWVPIDVQPEMMANITDIRLGKTGDSEMTRETIRLALSMATIRVWYREGITSDMRIVELTGSRRTMQIIGGPTVINDYRRELEFTVEVYTS